MIRKSVLTCFLLSLFVGLAARADDVPGIVKAKPAEGRYVDLGDGRFMVPYAQTIPGTDVKFEMVPVPGGKFKMGSPDSEKGRNDDEGPQFEVAVEPFWMGKHEVTWAEYRSFMRMYDVFKRFQSAGVRAVTESNKADAVTIPTPLYEAPVTYQRGQEPEQPAATMTPYAARHYTKWLSLQLGSVYRLPTEAEWEYAARAGTITAYPFGDDAKPLGDHAVFEGNAWDKVLGDEVYQKVGVKKANAWGLHDMLGNVSELVIDQYLEDHYQQFAGKSVSWKDVIAWPTKRSSRSHRGGWCESTVEECRSAARGQTDDKEWKIKDPQLPKSPWWYASDPPIPVGMRVIRPLIEPSRAEAAKFWEDDVKEIQEIVNNRLEGGRAVQGVVDKDLPKAVEELKSSADKK